MITVGLSAERILLERVGLLSYIMAMTAIAEKLDAKLTSWDRETATQVERIVGEVIELADADVLDILPSREVAQEVLDIIDED